MSALQTNSHTLEEQIVDLNVENGSLRSQMRTLKEEIQIHKSELAVLAEANNELKNENNILIERNHLLSNYLKSYNELKDTLDTMNSANMNLHARINAVQTDMLFVENENKELSETVHLFRRKTETNEVKNQIKNRIKKKQIGDHKQTINELQQDIMLLHSELIYSDESDEKTEQTSPITTTALGPLPDIDDPDMERNIMKLRSIDASMVLDLDDIGVVSRKYRSNSMWSTQSGASTVFEHERGVSCADLRDIQEWQETVETSDEYQVLLYRLKTVEKECRQIKQELEHKSNVIKALRASNIRLGKRLGTGRKLCYYKPRTFGIPTFGNSQVISQNFLPF